MKRCSKCKIEKQLSEFYMDRRVKKDGLQVHCKECFKLQHKEYRKTIQYKKVIRLYRNTSEYKEKHKKLHSIWQKSNKGKKYLKEYRKRSYVQEYRRSYEINYKKRDYVKLKANLYCLAYQTRKETSDDGTITYQSVNELLLKQRNLCAFCRIDLTKTKKHLDHIYPISKGGIHSINNVQWLCYLCNIRKSNHEVIILPF